LSAPITSSAERKCLHCQEFFRPDHRNLHHQRYFSKFACRGQSKAESQRRWLQKPENQNYFRGPDNCQRVKEWRKRNPGYWRKKRLIPAVSPSSQTIYALCVRCLRRRLHSSLGYPGARSIHFHANSAEGVLTATRKALEVRWIRYLFLGSSPREVSSRNIVLLPNS
jgi:hypothetical protein